MLNRSCCFSLSDITLSHPEAGFSLRKTLINNFIRHRKSDKCRPVASCVDTAFRAEVLIEVVNTLLLAPHDRTLLRMSGPFHVQTSGTNGRGQRSSTSSNLLQLTKASPSLMWFCEAERAAVLAAFLFHSCFFYFSFLLLFSLYSC